MRYENNWCAVRGTAAWISNPALTGRLVTGSACLYCFVVLAGHLALTYYKDVANENAAKTFNCSISLFELLYL